MTKGYLKTSEIGISSMVRYRAKILGILPMVNNHGHGENVYTLEDANKILAYKPYIRFHSIQHFETFKIIIENDNLRYNIPYASKLFRLKQPKIQAMLDEYKESGCFVVPSKMNYDED